MNVTVRDLRDNLILMSSDPANDFEVVTQVLSNEAPDERMKVVDVQFDDEARQLVLTIRVQ